MYRLLIGSVFLLLSCGSKQEDAVNLQPRIKTDQPVILPVQQYRDTFLAGPFFEEVHYSSLPAGETDTLKYAHSAEISFKERDRRVYFKNCIALLTPGSLLLNFRESTNPDSLSTFEFHLARKDNRYFAQLNFMMSVLDSNWRNPVYTILDQYVWFNKNNYLPGDSLKGKVDLLIEGHHTAFESNYRDTFRLTGLIKTKITDQTSEK